VTDWVLSIRNPLRERVAVAWATGMASPPIADVELASRLNDRGDWRFEMPAEAHAAQFLIPRAGVVLTRDGVVVFSGPIRGIVERHAADGTTIEVSGIDDTGQLGERTVWPDPAGPPFATSHDVRTGPAETRLHEYVSYHAANNALPRRNIEGLSLGVNSGRGTVGTTRARFDNLLELLQKVAAPDGLVFQVRQIEGEFQFQTRVSRDLRSSVIFGFDRRNLASVTVTDDAPVANGLVAGGDDEGTRRAFAELGDPDSIARWGLVEGFYDIRSATSPDELNAALREELAASAEVIGLEIDPTESATTQAHRDYDLGDRVTVVLPGGENISGYVSELRTTIDEQGVTVTPIVTTVPLSARPRSGLSHTTSRVAFLEANAENSRVPGSVVYLWAGAIEDIPAGHELCDGTSGTPDLTDFFIVGAGGAYAQFATGGADTVDLAHGHGAGTLLGPNHDHGAGTLKGPQHDHTSGTYAADSHGHGAGTLLGPQHDHTSGTYTTQNGVTGEPSATSNRADGGNAVGSATHTHITPQVDVTGNSGLSGDGAVTGSTALSGVVDVTGNSGLSGDGAVTGSTALGGNAAVTGSTADALGTHDNRPSFKAIAFIMRTAA